MPQVAAERGEPCAAQHSAEIPHGVFAAHAGPVGQRRSSQHDRTCPIGVRRRHHHDLPTCLAVGDNDGFDFGLGMARRHVLDEYRLGPADVLDGLSRHWLRQEADEIAGMACGQCHADFAVLLHSANTRPVAGTGIDDDDRRLGRIELGAGRRYDAHQRVVHRSIQRAAVAYEFSLKGQYVRDFLRTLLLIDVSPLSQDVEKQDRSLPGV